MILKKIDSITLSGYVVHGNQLGTKIGFPTANVAVLETENIPSLGVYAVFVKFENQILKGMLNIGLRPTIPEKEKQIFIEVHIFDFNENLYEKFISLEILYFIRNEMKFESLEKLKSQLEEDKIIVKSLI